MEVLLAT